MEEISIFTSVVVLSIKTIVNCMSLVVNLLIYVTVEVFGLLACKGESEYGTIGTSIFCWHTFEHNKLQVYKQMLQGNLHCSSVISTTCMGMGSMLKP